MIQHSLNGVALVAALALSATAAQASINIGDHLTISDDGHYLGPIDSGLFEIGYVNDGVVGTPFGETYAGPFDVTVVNTSQHNNSFNLLTFCTDVAANWNDSSTAYTAMTFASAVGVNPPWSAVPQAIQNAAWIYQNYFLNQEAKLIKAAGTTAGENQAAGVQLAIWKVLYDTTSSGGLDSLSVTSANNNKGNYFDGGQLQAYGFAGIADADSYLTALLNARSGGHFHLILGNLAGSKYRK
jgi:hypothetical protein